MGEKYIQHEGKYYKEHTAILSPITEFKLSCIKKRIDITEGTEEGAEIGELKRHLFSNVTEGWEPYQLYILSNDKVPYIPHVPNTSGIFFCLDEIDHPEDVLVFNVGNCGGCRAILGSTNTDLDVPILKVGFTSDFCQMGGTESVWVEYDPATSLPIVNYSDNVLSVIVPYYPQVYTYKDMLTAFKAGVDYGDANCETGGNTRLPYFYDWIENYKNKLDIQ